MKTTRKYTAVELVAMIRQKYSGRDFAVLEQVANATGYGCGSWIDAAVFSLRPSKGLWRAAMEVKISRADFLNELKSPGKNSWCREYFHEFWFVAPGEVIKEEELPAGVGWMKPRGDGLSIVRHASRITPKIDDEFLAALTRSMDKERSRFEKDAEQRILANSNDHQTAIAFQQACESFIKARGGHAVWMSDKAAIEKELIDATTDKGVKELLEHSQQVLDGFRTKMLAVMELFAKLCAYTINQRDETGHALFAAWGNADTSSIQALRDALKAKKTRRHIADDASTLQLIDAVMEGVSQ